MSISIPLCWAGEADSAVRSRRRPRSCTAQDAKLGEHPFRRNPLTEVKFSVRLVDRRVQLPPILIAKVVALVDGDGDDIDLRILRQVEDGIELEPFVTHASAHRHHPPTLALLLGAAKDGRRVKAR
jgi:hypothetical protein